MARYRTVKPEFWSSEQIMECSRDARLLFIGLWNFCDDAGRHPFSPKQIKALVFPGDETLTVADIQRMLYELSKNNLIARYTVDNKEYFYVTGWQHQKIDKPQKPKYPGPIADLSPTVPRTVSTERNTECREEGKGKEEDPVVPARAKFFSDEVGHLADRIMEAQGLDKHDTQCIGLLSIAKMWLEEWGWQPDVCVETVKRLMTKRTKPPNSAKYFEQAIADAHAELTRPLPEGSTGPPRRQRTQTAAEMFIELDDKLKGTNHDADDTPREDFAAGPGVILDA